MAEKITALTKEQEAKLPEYKEKWISLGLSTQEFDEEKAKAAVDQVYLCAGLKPPKIRILLNSPYEGVIGAWWLKQVLKTLKGRTLDQARVKIMAEAGEDVGNQVGNQLRADVVSRVRDQIKPKISAQIESLLKEKIGEPVKDQVRDRVWGHVWNQIKDQQSNPRLEDIVWNYTWERVWTQLWEQIWGQKADLGAQIGAQIKAEILAQVRNEAAGQIEDLLQAQSHCAGLHDANLLATYDFSGKELGMDVSKLSGLMAAAEHCGWFWPFGGAVIITEKPARIRRDDEGRLHDEKDMAIRYSDGWGVWLWYGARVEGWMITNPELITIDKIVDEKNAPVRRIMRERFGFQEFFLAMIREGSAKKVSRRKDASGLPMTLYRYFEKEAPVHFVHVYNGVEESDGTRKEFIIGCRNICDDALDSLVTTYPRLNKELKDNPRKFEILKSTLR